MRARRGGIQDLEGNRTTWRVSRPWSYGRLEEETKPEEASRGGNQDFENKSSLRGGYNNLEDQGASKKGISFLESIHAMPEREGVCITEHI